MFDKSDEEFQAQRQARRKRRREQQAQAAKWPTIEDWMHDPDQIWIERFGAVMIVEESEGNLRDAVAEVYIPPHLIGDGLYAVAYEGTALRLFIRPASCEIPRFFWRSRQRSASKRRGRSRAAIPVLTIPRGE